MSVPRCLGECWSMDFMNDSFENHCRFRTFNVIDDFSRERLYIDIAISLSAGRIITRYFRETSSISRLSAKNTS